MPALALVLLLGANAGLYLLMADRTGRLAWDAHTLLSWGGNLGVLILEGQWWRLLTYQFLHAGPGHIIGNMLLLAITGSYVSAKVGAGRFLLSYLLCGVAAGAASAMAHPQVVGVGASGAIAGLVGIMVVFYLSRRGPEISGAWLAQTLGINAAYSLAPNVDWVAHLGGFGAGLLCGAGLLALAPHVPELGGPEQPTG